MTSSAARSLTRLLAWTGPLRDRPLLQMIAGGKRDSPSSSLPMQVSESGRFSIKLSGSGGPKGPSGSGKKVLIIDLSPPESTLTMVVDLVGVLLEKHGNRTYKCQQVKESAMLFEQKRPNLVVISALNDAPLGADFGLIRSIKERSPLTMVMLLLEERSSVLRHSPADYLLFQPTDPNELELQISNALNRQIEQAIEMKELEINRRHELLVTGAASAAHEINNILMAISGQLELIGKLVEPLGKAVLNIEPNLDQAFQALNRLKRFAKNIMELGRTRPAEGVFNLNEVIEDAVGMARERIEGAGIELAVQLESSVPGLYGDRVAFFHAILNLLINARDATPPGGKISIVSWQTDGETRIGITDTGSGMPREVIPNIFKTFFTTKAPQKGTGLGLSIVEGVVTSLGGEIKVNSKEGLGTTFTIILPQQRKIA